VNRLFVVAGLVVAAAAACDDGNQQTVHYDLQHISTAQTYWDYPFPSDRRLDASGAPDVAAFPNPRNVPIRGKSGALRGAR